MLWKARRFTFDFSKINRALIVGILNITPDSFSDGQVYYKMRDAVTRAFALQAQGAHIIDIGAESTRPGAVSVSASEEIQRLLPVLKKIVKKISVPISIDTTKAEVARACLDIGASIINDVSGLKKDPAMAAVVKKYKAGLIVMHMRGEPSTMQRYTRYRDLIKEIKAELQASLQVARTMGIDSRYIAIDPGIGFSKTVKQNIRIIRFLRQLKSLQRPLIIGTSRKSFIGKVLHRDVNDRLAGTLASISCAVAHGADMVRVHDVKEAHDFLTMMHMINSVT